MKTKLLFVTVLLMGIALHGQEITIKTEDGKEHVIKLQAIEKEKQENDTIVLSKLLEKFKLYNSIFKEEYHSLEKYTDAGLNKLMAKSATSYKFKRDSVYDVAIKLKKEYVKAGKKKEQLDNYFPDDISFIEAAKNCETKKEEEKKKTNLLDRFVYLNALDFDFANTKTGYVGHLNVYSPPKKQFRWGFNAGLLKINYSNNDSLMRERKDNILIKPLDELEVGSSYIRQFNQYKNRTRNMSYSIYFQPLLRLNKEDKKLKILAHGHIELLVSKYETNTEISTIYQDTITIDSPDAIPTMVFPVSRQKSVASKNIINGYFGAGLSWDVNILEDSSLFFQATSGYTTNYPSSSARRNNMSYRIDEINEWKGFYLIRAFFNQGLTTDTELILGTDIRGMYGQQNPGYAVYIGINVGLNALKKIFG